MNAVSSLKTKDEILTSTTAKKIHKRVLLVEDEQPIRDIIIPTVVT